MNKSFEINLKVSFYDLDPMRVVWHGNYLKYFDKARFALFDNYGIDLYKYLKTKQYVFPITRSNVKYIAPLQYNDEFVCKATVTEAKYKIVTDFEIHLTDNGSLCARARSEQLAVKFPEMEMQFEIPFEIRKALGFD